MRGVIATGHPQTAAAGANILNQGGNAVDAAVAATFSSFVAEALLVNIGGGGIAQVFDPVSHQSAVYDFFVAMPGLSPESPHNPDRLDFRQVQADFGSAVQEFHIGRGSVAVPGVVAGLCRMVEDMGSLPLRRILAPAIGLAREGVRVTPSQAYVAKLLTPILTDTPEIAAIFAPGGRIVRSGDRIDNQSLAQALEELAAQGSDFFYLGDLSQKILADQQNHGGLITKTDLRTYQAYRTEPIVVDYRGYTIHLPASASTGGVLIAFSLKLLGSLSLETVMRGSFDHLRTLAEVMRFTNIARAGWEARKSASGATDQSDVIETIMGAANVNQYQKKLHESLAGTQVTVEPKGPESSENTTHISVVDARGMVVGITTSTGENAGFVVGDTGVMLNNMLGESDLHPEGFHKRPPGRRLPTMMSPTVVLKDGLPVMVIGSGGSNRLRSAILQVISNALDFGMNLSQAVMAPRVHYEGGVIQLEGGNDSKVADQLVGAGYEINLWPDRNLFFGGTHAIALEGGTTWVAVGDPRRGGAVAILE